MRNLVVQIEKWISIRQLVPVLYRVFRSPGVYTVTRTAATVITAAKKKNAKLFTSLGKILVKISSKSF